MLTSSAAKPGASEATASAGSQGSVAGRIKGEPGEVEIAIDAWLQHLAGLRRSPGTITAYREMSARAVRECGWSRLSDVTFDAVTEWLSSKNWMGVTYNRNLSTFRSFTKFLWKSGRLDRDPLMDAPRAEDDGSDGSRAATTEELRAIVRQAAMRVASDGRSDGVRDVVWCILPLCALRVGEPFRWKRKHVNLDHAVPHIHWDKTNQKIKRERWIALHPEAAELLREYRDEVDARRAAEDLEAMGPEDAFFQKRTKRRMFNVDREKAGVDASDWRDRPLTSHGCRKWFSTTMTELGVPEKMVDYLMRHAGRPEHRYYDPTLEEQLAAVSKLPTLRPKALSSRDMGCGKPKSLRKRLTDGGQISEDRASKSAPISNNQTVPIKSPIRSAAPASNSALRTRVGDLGGTGTERDADEAAIPDVLPDFGLQNAGLGARNLVVRVELTVEMLEAIAAVLRGTRSIGHAISGNNAG